MRGLYFGLLLVGLASAAHASEEGGCVSVSNPGQSIVQFMHSGTDFIAPCRFNADAVLTRTSYNIAPSGSGLGSTTRLSSVAEPKKETMMATNSRVHEIPGGGRASLTHLTRVEFNSAGFKVTLRPDAASMETGNFKVALRSGSTSLLWSKAL